MMLSISYFFQARKSRKKEWVGDDNYFEKANGTFTVQYPHEQIPVPDHGRYQLHNEIDDCIVCDKCAKVCPVDCIDIEPVRSPEVFGQTSDGTPLRIHAARFDIDMSKCFFCGLCTVVCPTECLTMTKEFDFSTTDILDHNFSFSKMSELEIEEKKKEFEDYQASKERAKSELPKIQGETAELQKPKMKPAVKPVLKPKIKPGAKAKPLIKPKIESDTSAEAKKPVIKPVIKSKTQSEESVVKKKPIMKPRIPKK